MRAERAIPVALSATAAMVCGGQEQPRSRAPGWSPRGAALGAGNAPLPVVGVEGESLRLLVSAVFWR